MHGAAEAAITDYLSDNGMQDYDERTKAVVERIYQHGIRLHGVILALGQAGIELGIVDGHGTRQTLQVGSAEDYEMEKARTPVPDSLLSELVDNAADRHMLNTSNVYETADLLGRDPDDLSIRIQCVGMLAVHIAAVEHARAITKFRTVDLLNKGAQVYCGLSNLQSSGASQLYLYDSESYMLPLPDDLNGLALGDNHHWLEDCGPVKLLT